MSPYSITIVKNPCSPAAFLDQAANCHAPEKLRPGKFGQGFHSSVHVLVLRSLIWQYARDWLAVPGYNHGLAVLDGI